MALLPSNLPAWLATDEGQTCLRAGGAKATAACGRYSAGFTEQLDEATLQACRGSEALVAMHITYLRTVAIADLLQVPTALAWTIPGAKTAAYGSPMLRIRMPGAAARRLSHALPFAINERMSRKSVQAYRRRLGVPVDAGSAIARLDAARVLQLHPVSPTMLPTPTDWGPEHRTTGLWRMPDRVRNAAGETITPELSDWLDAGDPPVYLGLGSMPILDPTAFVHDAAAVTAELGLRAIIDVGGQVDLSALPEHVYAVGPVDHDELFSRCRAVMHHGGAGSTAASLRAGTPTLVCTVFADQPFWGRRVEKLGAGVRMRFADLDRRSLRAGLRLALEPAIAERARAVGEAIRAEGDGTLVAAHALEDWLTTADPLPLPSAR
jgi:sterol 3beta-glucosyltransferase